MKAILIDPNVPIIDEVDIELSSLAAIYKLIGCQQIEAIRFPDADDWIILDEEGKLGSKRASPWRIKGFHDVLVGRGLVVGVNEWGAEVSPAMSLMDVADRVEFLR